MTKKITGQLVLPVDTILSQLNESAYAYYIQHRVPIFTEQAKSFMEQDK